MEQPRLDAPRPGMGMTHELGARPWQTPPKLAKVDDVVQDYLIKMQDDSFVKQLVGVLESGVPVTTLANTIQLAGVMEGRHSVDTGMLVIPVLMEMIMLIADKAGIKYDSGMDKDDTEATKDTMIASVLEEMTQELEKKDTDEIDNDEEQSTETESEPMGLMSRRAEMSFWGGFVEGFATTAKEEIDKDVARTNQIVDDTVKIGVSKALETQEEIKKDKKRIRDELEMLTTQGFSVAKAASIVKAGMTSKIITLRNNTKNRLGADQLWDGTTKFAQDNKLTIKDVVDKLSYQEPLDYGNLNVATPKGSLLGALGLAPEVDTKIQEGIMSRVGKLDTGVDRSDISILPGSIPLEAKKQFDTDKTVLSLSQRASQLIQKQYTPEGLNETEQSELDDITVRLNPKAEKLLNIYGKDGLGKLGLAKPDVSPKELQDLYTKSQGESKEAMEAKEKLKSEIDRIRKKYGKDYSNSLILGFK